MHQWREANAEAVLEYNRQYNKAHREERREQNREYRKANPEKVNEKDRRWRKANPDKVREHSRIASPRHRALKLNAPVRDLTAKDWQAVLDHYGHKCAYCGATKDLTQDHIIPLSRGGWHTISNITVACRSCNARKGTRTPAEARIYLWQLPLTKEVNNVRSTPVP